MIEYELGDYEFIELNKLLKLMSLVNTGGAANIAIENGEVIVNEGVETQKRKKLRTGDKIVYKKYTILIK